MLVGQPLSSADVRPNRKFRCEHCEHDFQSPPYEQPEACPACGHRYFVWVNYEKWLASEGPPKSKPNS